MQLRDETDVEDEVDNILNEMESTFDTDSQAVEKVAPLLKHVDVARRTQGIMMLGSISSDEDGRRKALQHLLNDEKQEVKAAAKEALKQMDMQEESP